MTGATHGGKGDGRRPEAKPGAYGGGFDRIDWNARDREAVADRVVVTPVPAEGQAKGSDANGEV